MRQPIDPSRKIPTEFSDSKEDRPVETKRQRRCWFQGLPGLWRNGLASREIGIFFMALAMLFTCVPQASANLVANYSFSGDANDTSGYENNGLVVGGATLTTDRFGQTNSAYHFNGIDQYISITNRPYLDINQTTGFTISTWFKFTGSNNDGQMALIDKHAYEGWGIEIDFTSNPDNLGFFTRTSQAWVPDNLGNTPLPQDGEWHHLAGTVLGGNLKFYLDGSLQYDVTFGGIVKNDSSNLILGANSRWGRYFQGDLDEVRIYNQALSGQEIGQLAAAPLPGTALLLTSGLIMLLGMRRKYGRKCLSRAVLKPRHDQSRHSCPWL